MSEIEQEQNAGTGLAVQSGRDTTFNQGITVDQVCMLLDSMSANMKLGVALMDDRFKEFKLEVMKRLDDEAALQREAFKDPDFLYVLAKAQHQYARTDDTVRHKNLLDLIVLRSKQNESGRLALTLNDAVDKASVLTRNEFAELSMCFLIRNTQFKTQSIQELSTHLNRCLVPLLDDISVEHSSYTYLESHSCASIDITSLEFRNALLHSYGGLFSKGFDNDWVTTHFAGASDGDRIQLLIPCLNDSSKVQLAALSRHLFLEKGALTSVNPDNLNSLYTAFEGTFWTEAEIIENLSPLVPDIARAFELWNTTALKNLILTSVGTALGYTNVAQFGFDADLSIWIK
jgi:hypothetical protein